MPNFLFTQLSIDGRDWDFFVDPKIVGAKMIILSSPMCVFGAQTEACKAWNRCKIPLNTYSGYHQDCHRIFATNDTSKSHIFGESGILHLKKKNETTQHFKCGIVIKLIILIIDVTA